MRRISIVLCAFLLAGLLLSSCSLKPSSDSAYSCRVAYINDGFDDAKNLFAFDEHYIDGKDTISDAKALLNQMCKEPQSGLKPAITPGTEPLSIKIFGSGLDIDMPGSYAGSAIERTAADAAIVLTLTSLKGINCVRITVDGQPTELRNDRYLTVDDFVLYDSDLKHIEYPVNLYFAAPGGNTLEAEERIIDLSEDASAEELVINALIGGPQSDYLMPTLPHGTKLIYTYTEGDICYVNLSGEFYNNHSGIPKAAHLTVYSIVNSLCELSGIDSVQFAVDGTVINDFYGIPADVPITPSAE